MKFQNIPEVKLGIIAVSRDCFPIALSTSRREAVVQAYGAGLYNCPVTVENEADALKALEDVRAAGCNALVVYLGNFGPETPETILAKRFHGPVMYVAAAEGDGDLINGRGRRLLRHAELLLQLGSAPPASLHPRLSRGYRPGVCGDDPGVRSHCPGRHRREEPEDHHLWPRPQDFFCLQRAPIQGLYELGVEVEENSELDLLVSYKAHAGDSRIEAVCADMAEELGVTGNQYPESCCPGWPSLS